MQDQSTVTRNRRVHYLEENPEYFSRGLESANPALYNTLVRKWQTPQERDEETKQKSASDILEASLKRDDARLRSIEAHKKPSNGHAEGYGPEEQLEDWHTPTDKSQAWELWKRIMGQRFVNGRDDQFDYSCVDNNERLDMGVFATQDIQEKYFDQEAAKWEVDDASQIIGQTGVQDF